MEKIVICYTSSDGATYSFDHTVPVLYESAEAALVHFEEAVWDAYRSKKAWMFFAGHEFDKSDFLYHNSRTGELEYYGPVFYTLEEWFDAFQPD